jgi:hypothetical protein
VPYVLQPQVVRDAKRAGYAYVVLDGTLIAIDRVGSYELLTIIIRSAQAPRRQRSGSGTSGALKRNPLRAQAAEASRVRLRPSGCCRPAFVAFGCVGRPRARSG